jgi:KDO2-lipid IV(A) lauroyltransferase
MTNLLQAFPEKKEKERITIAKKFYRSLTDTFIESIKLLSSGKTFVNKHCTADFSLLHHLGEKGESFQLHPAHQFNWELVNLHFGLHLRLPLVAVYMPLSNKIFEKIFYKNRSRYGTVLLPATDMKNSFLPWRNKPHLLALVADQNPGHPGNAYWLHFFNKPTPFVKGPERSAREKSCAVVFMFMRKIKRGHYHSEFILATENASLLKEGELTKRYAAALTQNMIEQPENWLWSHRRWKWDWKPEYGEILN